MQCLSLCLRSLDSLVVQTITHNSYLCTTNYFVLTLLTLLRAYPVAYPALEDMLHRKVGLSAKLSDTSGVWCL